MSNTIKVKNLKINKFRHLKNLEINFNNRLTAIAGSNGTGKSSLLGLIAGSFFFWEWEFGKKLSADFSEIFTFSPKKEGREVSNYEYTISLDDNSETSGTFRFLDEDKRPFRIDVQSLVAGDSKRRKRKIRLPVIYLGLRRLFPLAQEDSNLSITRSRKQDTEYKQWFDKYYRAILPTEKVFEYENYNSDNKNFLSVVTTDFDSYGSSAGQDNLSQILTAIYAFKCLKENKGKDYRGWVLLVDEIDISFYPWAQVNLVRQLSRLADELKIQIIFTTHSLEIIETVLHSSSDSGAVFLEKVSDDLIRYKEDEQGIDDIILDLRHQTRSSTGKKIDVLCEDSEAIFILKWILEKEVLDQIDFVNANLGHKNYIQLLERKILTRQLIILDWDTEGQDDLRTKYSNLGFIPLAGRPENCIMQFLDSLNADDQFWDNKHHYRKQTFLGNREADTTDRKRMKNWFNKERRNWWSNGELLFDRWKDLNSELYGKFNCEIRDILKTLSH